MTRVLITGGAGYIGSHTAKALSAAGFQPIVLDNMTAGHRWAVQWGPLVEGDLQDQDLVRRVAERYNIEAVIHFAANAYVGESMQQPQKYFQNNVANTLSLLHVLLDCGLKHVVFSSSCATYGIPQGLPIEETHPQMPVNPYGESKLFIEKALHWYGKAYDLRSVSLRYFNAAGADPNGEIGEDHNPETHLIPLVMRAAGSGTQVSVYGADYPTEDGTAVRDYIHVSDLANAHVRALVYLLAGGESNAFNLGTGHGHSVHEVIRTVERVSGATVRTLVQPRRAGDPPELVAAAQKAHAVLGWHPKFSDLDQIVSTAWDWYSSEKTRTKRMAV